MAARTHTSEESTPSGAPAKKLPVVTGELLKREPRAPPAGFRPREAVGASRAGRKAFGSGGSQ
eukprot:14648684-Alexandrium_andersonii.AAC.1